MVAGISGGLSLYSNMFSMFPTNTNNIQNDNFETLINDVQNSPEIISPDDLEMTNEGNSTSEKNSNDMDLNKDGTISIDEIMKYMEIQEQENLTTGEMQGEHNNNNSNQWFKPSMSQVINAYSAFL